MPKDWLTYIPALGTAYVPWLHDHGSLTQRIQRRCAKFHVHNVCNGLRMANHDETSILNIPRRQHTYTREVLLHADNKPVVFAHSVVAAHHLRGAWHTLRQLGNRPLGALLFTHPLVQRSALHFRALKPDHPLFRSAALALDKPPPQLWARRSIFILHEAPLLVTEVFLPEILKLQLRQ
jgi:chorismate--pyruvate lyase